MKHDFELTVGRLKEALRGLPNDAPVFYHRIEDVYFENGWDKNVLKVPSDVSDIPDEYIRGFQAFKFDDKLLITAHF